MWDKVCCLFWFTVLFLFLFFIFRGCFCSSPSPVNSVLKDDYRLTRELARRDHSNDFHNVYLLLDEWYLKKQELNSHYAILISNAFDHASLFASTNGSRSRFMRELKHNIRHVSDAKLFKNSRGRWEVGNFLSDDALDYLIDYEVRHSSH